MYLITGQELVLRGFCPQSLVICFYNNQHRPLQSSSCVHGRVQTACIECASIHAVSRSLYSCCSAVQGEHHLCTGLGGVYFLVDCLLAGRHRGNSQGNRQVHHRYACLHTCIMFGFCILAASFQRVYKDCVELWLRHKLSSESGWLVR